MALLITMIACEESGSPSTTTDASISTATPTSVMAPWASAPRLTAKQLLDEREANATRFDTTRKDKWVRVSGSVERIDNGKVYLLGDGFLSNVVLEDLSQDVQIALNIGQDSSAACKVGDYILGSIYMYDCQADSAPAPGATATAMPSPTATTPEPTATAALMPTATGASVATPMPSATAAPTPTNIPTPVTTASISAGTYRVGTDLAAGLYRGDASTGILGFCYWARLSGLSGQLDEIIANDTPMGQFFVEIMETDAAFETGCTIEPVLDSGLTSAPPIISSITPGTYRIGIDIPAGLYRGDASNASTGFCYWARLSGFSGELEEIIANDVPSGQFFVQVAETDGGLSTSCALEWAP